MVKVDAKRTKRLLPDPDVAVQPKRKMNIKGTQLLRRYPVNSNIPGAETDETLQKHVKGITSELAKAKPRDSVLLPLMRSTYGQRRLFILNDAESVKDILDSHPALARQTVVNNLYAIVML